jgi:hypothetical protein
MIVEEMEIEERRLLHGNDVGSAIIVEEGELGGVRVDANM